MDSICIPWCCLDDVIHTKDHLCCFSGRDQHLQLHPVRLCDTKLIHLSNSTLVHVWGGGGEVEHMDTTIQHVHDDYSTVGMYITYTVCSSYSVYTCTSSRGPSAGLQGVRKHHREQQINGTFLSALWKVSIQRSLVHVAGYQYYIPCQEQM